MLEDFYVFRTINEIFRYIKQSTKKILMNKISTKLLGLEMVRKTKQSRLILLSNCAVCGKKNLFKKKKKKSRTPLKQLF